MRREFDIGKINKALKGKADLNESNTQFQNLQYSLSVLEMRHNQLHMDTAGLIKGAKLFEGRVHQLELDNRDVSVGRRNGNCISCSNKSDGYASLKYKDGKDGKLYITSGKAAVGKGMDTSAAGSNAHFVDIPNTDG